MTFCKAGMHAWGSWRKPYYHARAWYQARSCRRCGQVVTRQVKNYRPAEEDLAALEDLADRLGLPKVGKPIDAPGTIREPFDLGEIDPALAGRIVQVWTAGPTLGAMLDYVHEATGIMQDLVQPDRDVDALSVRINAWLCKAWGIGEADMVRVMGQLDAHGYLQAFNRTTELVMDRFQRLTDADTDDADDPPDLALLGCVGRA